MTSRSEGTVSCSAHWAQLTVSNLGFPGQIASDDHTLRRCAQEAAEAAIRSVS